GDADGRIASLEVLLEVRGQAREVEPRIRELLVDHGVRGVLERVPRGVLTRMEELQLRKKLAMLLRLPLPPLEELREVLQGAPGSLAEKAHRLRVQLHPLSAQHEGSPERLERLHPVVREADPVRRRRQQ